MKYVKEYNKYNDKIIEIMDYLETWEDEYDDFKFNLVEIESLNVHNASKMDSFLHLKLNGKGVLIVAEFKLPKILWKEQDKIKTKDYIKTNILVYKRIETLFTRLESMGTYPVYTDNTFLSNRLRSILVKVFISSDSL